MATEVDAGSGSVVVEGHAPAVEGMAPVPAGDTSAAVLPSHDPLMTGGTVGVT